MNKSMDNPIDEFSLYGNLRPDEHLSPGHLADVRAELFGPAVRSTRDDAPSAVEALMRSESMRSESMRSVTHIEPHQSRQAKRRMIVGLAAAVVMLGVAGIVISTQRSPRSLTGIGTVPPPATQPNSNPPDSTAATAATAATTPPETTAESQSATPADGSAKLSGRTMFMVPDYLPAGWRVTDIRAGDERSRWFQRWAQVDSSGKVTGLVVVYNPKRYPTNSSDQNAGDVTVRGQPGKYSEGQLTDEHVENILTWSESGWELSISGIDSAGDLVHQVAELLTFDPQTGTIDFAAAASVGLVAESDLGFVDTNALETQLQIGPSVVDQKVAVTSRPNRLGRDLKSLVHPEGANWTEITIDGRKAMRHATPERITTFWLDQGMYLVSDTDPDVSDDELAKIMHGIRFTDVAEYASVVSAMRQGTIAELSPWPEFDQVTIPAGPTLPSELPNGLTVSLRTRPGESGAHAMCLGSPVMNCAMLRGEGTSSLEGGSSITVGDRRIGAVWVSHDIVDASSTVEIRPNDWIFWLRDRGGISNIEQEVVTTASVLADVQTSTGRVVIVSWPVEEEPPIVSFPKDPEELNPVEVTPDEPGW